MAAKLLSVFKQKISELKLIPAGGGCFEVTADGALLYSKLQTGQFPDENEMVDRLSDRVRSK